MYEQNLSNILAKAMESPLPEEQIVHITGLITHWSEDPSVSLEEIIARYISSYVDNLYKQMTHLSNLLFLQIRAIPWGIKSGLRDKFYQHRQQLDDIISTVVHNTRTYAYWLISFYLEESLNWGGLQLQGEKHDEAKELIKQARRMKIESVDTSGNRKEIGYEEWKREHYSGIILEFIR